MRYSYRIRVPNVQELKDEILDESHSSRYSIHTGSTKMYRDLKEYYWWPNMKRDVAEWDEVREHKMLGHEVVQTTKDIVALIRGRLVAAQNRQKKYADLARKDKKYEVWDLMSLKLSRWKGLMRFGKKEKLWQ
ncbi:hypothetical protein AgCh_031043 [Apium graveolens]